MQPAHPPVVSGCCQAWYAHRSTHVISPNPAVKVRRGCFMLTWPPPTWRSLSTVTPPPCCSEAAPSASCEGQASCVHSPRNVPVTLSCGVLRLGQRRLISRSPRRAVSPRRRAAAPAPAPAPAQAPRSDSVAPSTPAVPLHRATSRRRAAHQRRHRRIGGAALHWRAAVNMGGLAMGLVIQSVGREVEGRARPQGYLCPSRKQSFGASARSGRRESEGETR